MDSEAIREELRAAAKQGNSFRELQDRLEVHRLALSSARFDEMWLFAWALARRNRASSPTRTPAYTEIKSWLP